MEVIHILGEYRGTEKCVSQGQTLPPPVCPGSIMVNTNGCEKMLFVGTGLSMLNPPPLCPSDTLFRLFLIDSLRQLMHDEHLDNI